MTGNGTGRVAAPFVVAAVVTAAVTAASTFLPDRYVATVVGLVFFGATWLFVWRGDDEGVERAGLAFGGAVTRGPLDVRRIAPAAWKAVRWAVGMSLLTFGPFFIGWRLWAAYVWHSHHRFALSITPLDAMNEIAGQFVIIALPEEAFYRGYLQSKLDEAWEPRWNVLGANVGPGLVATAAIFALGHLATVQLPARLAVFFPALLFGWLRARTGGIGASVCFHATCNVYSLLLGRGYGLY